MSMKSYQAIVGPADQDGPDDLVLTVMAEHRDDACYRAGIVAMAERGLPSADYIVKSCVTQAEFMSQQFRMPGYAALVETYEREEEPPVEEYDPGPEVDDMGGMSEYQYFEPADY